MKITPNFSFARMTKLETVAEPTEAWDERLEGHSSLVAKKRSVGGDGA